MSDIEKSLYDEWVADLRHRALVKEAYIVGGARVRHKGPEETRLERKQRHSGGRPVGWRKTVDGK